MVSIEVSDLVISYRPLNNVSIQKDLFRRKKKSKPFVAVDNVSFQIEKGEILGLIGKNGSGKSTILKAIAGVFTPDSGTIDLKGQSVSLLAIGVGFKPEMTGRENIYIAGLLLGFSKAMIKEKEEAIIEFAELGHFIDMPVKTYSSGMYSKLSFAITAMMETDIMLIDEVLSVGDERFKKKSYEKMKELISSRDRTVVVVSHNLSTLKELCDKILWLNDGKVVKMGDVKEILDEYQAYMRG